ncbi:MAG: TolC family protein [Saprospiraceae bacterium]|nr:TolC family protein [Saprospiraceae bacterium]
MKIVTILFFLTITTAVLRGQDTTILTLAQVVEMAKMQSIAARQAATTKETRYWEYRTFQSNYKPQLVLNGNLPAYSRAFREVLQPDGRILFQPVQNNNSALNLALQQNITRTGGTIYANTVLQRFDDFDRKNTLYNGTLFAVGLEQPLFKFNPLKWDKQIEPLKYRESQQEFLEEMERIALKANELYFDLLLAQVNLKISATNLKNTEGILRIANEKFELGKVSRNEILQLKLELLKSQKAVATAQRDLEISTLNLKSFIGSNQSQVLKLIEPEPQNPPSVSATKLLAEAFDNRSDAIAFGRRLMEADRMIAKAKGDNGINANLVANLGFSNSAPTVSEVVKSPKNYQDIQILFSVPIIDWGRSQSRIKTAEAQRQLTQYAVEQDKQTFQQAIFTQVTLFEMLKNQLALTKNADEIASEKYQIAQERYVLGNLSITDLSIAFAEKDQAKRDFIGVLRDYWAAFYRLRWLTLYDFEKGEKIR